jgi:cell division protein FtsI/penicillin-binding protein 2
VERLRKTLISGVGAALLAVMCVVSDSRQTRASATDTAQLYSQTAASLLERRFQDPNASYLLLDPATGSVLASRWENPDEAVYVGSLIKPFTAMAYARSHSWFPQVTCAGAEDVCWLPHGHGRLDLARAVAYSCNAYFRTLAKQIKPEDESQVLSSYGLPSSLSMDVDEMAGLESAWKASPLDVARAYGKLVAARGSDSTAPIFAGMQMSAKFGTARGVGEAVRSAPASAKTGTAACTHGGAANDGFAVVFYPADSPRLELLVRLHAAPGAHAASLAGAMLHTLLEGN